MKHLIIFFFFFSAFLSEAATITSIGDGDWNDPNTWDCNCIPGPNDDVQISAEDEITLDVTDFPGDTVRIASFTLLAGGGGTKATKLFLSGAGGFYITGNMDLQAKTELTVFETAIVVGGDLTWTNNGNIDVVGNGGGATLLVEGCGDGPGGGASNNPDNIISGDLTWCVGDASCAGSGQGSGGSNGGAGCNDILPVQLLSFEAVLKNDFTVDLNWATASEINNDYFSVEKSYDGQNFTEISNIGGAGNSKSTIKYYYNDNDELSSINYYRLKQVDFDGKFTYSRIRQIKVDGENSIGIYPNPTGDNIFNIKAVKSSIANVKVYNMTGQEVLLSHKNSNITGDFVTATYEITAVAKGFYIIMIETESDLIKQKLLVK